jgi:hypothetical protein
MKKNDIAAIIAIAAVSIIVAYFGANAVIGKPTGQTEKVRTIEVIHSDVAETDSRIFNKDAINPTVEVVIGENK